jgi:hypothetical protein
MCREELTLHHNKKRDSQPILQAQLKTAQANTRPMFLIELAKPIQQKICFLKKTHTST